MRPKDTRSDSLQPSSAAVSAAVVPDRSATLPRGIRTNHDNFIKETDDTLRIRNRIKVLLPQRFFGFDIFLPLCHYREIGRKSMKMPMGILRPLGNAEQIACGGQRIFCHNFAVQKS